jgi:hypothetical protein
MNTCYKLSRYLFSFFLFLSFAFEGKSQIGIGTNTVDSSAMLDVVSTSRGFLPPRMTTSQILAIDNPKAGLIAYNVTKNQPVFFNGTEWKYYCGDSTLINGSLSSGLLTYFPFTGNYNDQSGNQNNGYTPGPGGSLTTTFNGQPNAAFNCLGNGQQLIVNNNGLIQYDSAFSVSFDAMVRNNTTRHHFVSMLKYLDGAGISFAIGVNSVGNPNLTFSIVDPLYCSMAIPTQTTVQDAGFALLPETWYNVICTFNRGTLRLYLNGVLRSTITTPTKAVSVCSGSQVLIGGWWQQDPGASLNGKIDEVRLYNRALNLDEVRELSKKFR